MAMGISSTQSFPFRQFPPPYSRLCHYRCPCFASLASSSSRAWLRQEARKSTYCTFRSPNIYDTSIGIQHPLHYKLETDPCAPAATTHKPYFLPNRSGGGLQGIVNQERTSEKRGKPLTNLSTPPSINFPCEPKFSCTATQNSDMDGTSADWGKARDCLANQRREHSSLGQVKCQQKSNAYSDNPGNLMRLHVANMDSSTMVQHIDTETWNSSVLAGSNSSQLSNNLKPSDNVNGLRQTDMHLINDCVKGETNGPSKSNLFTKPRSFRQIEDTEVRPLKNDDSCVSHGKQYIRTKISKGSFLAGTESKNSDNVPKSSDNLNISWKTDNSVLTEQVKGYETNGSSKTVKRENLEQIGSYTVEHVLPGGELTGTVCNNEVKFSNNNEEASVSQDDLQKNLTSIYRNVCVVDSISKAKKVVAMLTRQYGHLVHSCDTEVAKIDVKQETPVDHGEVTCFSIYSGPGADFGDGKSCIWVDVLDGGGRDLLLEFAPFFENPSIKKVWHNYSFDNHVMENYGLKLAGFHADTMHMARLWDSSRRTKGGYSLEALTGDKKVMWMKGNQKHTSENKNLLGKISMKTIFGQKKIKRDGSEGKIVTIASVEELQREKRDLWICYSALDSISTLQLYESLKEKLLMTCWKFDGVAVSGKSMFDFYLEYWRPFGEVLVKMETEGMLVDRVYLAEIETVAKAEQEIAGHRFRRWATKHCPDAKYMNVGSDAQLRQLFFGGTKNSNTDEELPFEREFNVPNVDKIIEEGKKVPKKFRTIKLHKIGGPLSTDTYTPSGWPSIGGDNLKILAGKVTAEYDIIDENLEIDDSITTETPEPQESFNLATVDHNDYGTAFEAFKDEGKEACHAIAALCEICSIDSLISNFILPLQGSNISGKNGRVHCSLNINTETGRLSARRPNLQNQPALEKDRYKIRQAFIASPGNSLIVADYGQLELRILAHLTNCKSMFEAFEAGGDFHSRTAMNMYPHIRDAVEKKKVLLEWDPQPGQDKPPVSLLKDAYASERRKAKMLNFSIAYGKTPVGLSRDWKVSVEEATKTVNLWYGERQEVLAWQQARKEEAIKKGRVHTLLGRARQFPSLRGGNRSLRGRIERAAINTPVQGSAADVAMCAMLEISNNVRLKELGWRLLLQVHDEVILEGPTESAEVAKAIVVECMSKPFYGKNILKVALSVDAKCAQNWYAGK